MSNIAPNAPEQLRGQLVEAGLLFTTGVDGLFGRSAAYEAIVTALGDFAHALGAGQDATVLSFPPVVDRHVFERTGFPESFPNLVGAVRCFSGSDEEHGRLLRALFAGGDWSEEFGPTDIVLCSAACHPIYPACAGGRVPPGGRRFEICGYCFRHEPSLDPTRMQAFRMYEHVYVGESETALAHRDDWLQVSCEALRGLGLDVSTAPANDPFFGRAAGMLADIQREEDRKIEIMFSLPGYSSPTAIASGNWHKEHFGERFGIESADGNIAHSACMAFGLDRIALSLFATHGFDATAWPAEVRSKLST